MEEVEYLEDEPYYAIIRFTIICSFLLLVTN